MKTVKEFDFGEERARIDYVALFDGEVHIVESGVDFKGSQASAMANIRTNAKRRGMKIRIGKAGDNVAVQKVGVIETTPEAATDAPEEATEEAPAETAAKTTEESKTKTTAKRRTRKKS